MTCVVVAGGGRDGRCGPAARGNRRRRTDAAAGVMPVSCNALAKYLVMASQMIAWCTVSAMLLRRGMNQVTSTGAGDQHRGNATGTADAVAGADQRVVGPDRQFDGNGTPAVVAGVVMIAIAAIMLVVSPTVMLIKMIEKRRRRVLDAVSPTATAARTRVEGGRPNRLQPVGPKYIF